jgi:predicted Fe-Mo cluster-binding NifX family protein
MMHKVAVASDDQKTIAPHFGRTRGFVLFKIEGEKKDRVAYLPNTFTGHAVGPDSTDHGYEHHKSILDALKDCATVISHGMGRRIYADLKSHGINVYVTGENDIEKAIDLYIKGELIDDPNRTCSHHNECRGE